MPIESPDIEPSNGSGPPSWISQDRTIDDTITLGPLTRLARTFMWATPHPRKVVPPLWHWVFAMPAIACEDIGEDGHERLGLFLPELPPSVRMWAAGAITFHDALCIGDNVTVTSKVTEVATKRGRAGLLTFVTVAHDWRTERGPALVEKQILVYKPIQKGAQRPASPPPLLAPPAQILAHHRIDDTQMFRYSALTFNSHRIHLDRGYCERHDGDSRLVVHGPLLATFLANAGEQIMEAPLAAFSFRAVSPVREDEPFEIRAGRSGDCCQLWIVGTHNDIKMTGQARMK